jgi:HemY protein
MTRLVVFLIVILAIAAGLDWLADRPGIIVVEWQGYVAETSVFRAFILLLMLLAACLVTWSALRSLWSSPATVGRFLNRRREQRGLDALSSGMIAIGAGDRTLALRYAGQARKALPNEPLTHLLRAQAAELTGDRTTSRRIFEAMLASPDTEQLGLRGLFLEARREGEQEAARQFAERALKLNAKLDWPVEALFDLQCRAGNWQGALDTLAIAKRQNLVDRNIANRRRAVLLTAQAQAAEDTSPEKALELALEAHRLAPDLVPAAAIGGRILASQGNTPRAARVLLRTWRLAPHPDLAAAYAYARPGDSPRDRLNRMRHLARLTPHDAEGPIAFAITAIDAREWDEARKTLEPLLEGRLTQRVAALMARIEGEQHGHAGRVREWLARAVNAPRDPAWTADGTVSDRWAPVSPVTGALDAFRWRVPVEETGGAVLTARAEAMAALGAGSEPLIAHPDAVKPAAAFPATETVDPVAPPPAPAAPAAAPITVEAVPVLPQAVVEPKPTAAPRNDPPVEATPIAARVAAPADVAAEADLGERIRLAAQRAIAAGERDKAAATTPPTKPAAPKSAAAKPAEPMRSAPAKRAEMPQPVARKAPEPKIYVPPRAPDDPGPDLVEERDLEIGPLRPSGAKA